MFLISLSRTHTICFHWSIYCDDYFLVSEADSAKRVDMCINSFFAVLGWEISSDKDLKYDFFAEVLSVQIRMKSATLFEVVNTPERRAELVESINEILNASSCARKCLASLKGCLQFVEGQIFGRRSFMRMKLIGERALGEGKVGVDQALRESLVYMRDRVVNGPPRQIMTKLANTWFLYTDACFETGHPVWEAGIGGVLVGWGGKPIAFFTFKCNDRVMELVNKAQLANPIYLLEGLAVVVGLTAWASLLKRSHVVSFVDNEGVLGSFFSCKSSQDAFCPILSALVNWEDELQTYAWFDYLPSEAKIVDPPSSGDCQSLVGFSSVPITEEDIVRLLAPA